MLTLVAAPWLLGCAVSQRSLAEREIERRAPEIIGPADRYDADVRGLEAASADRVTLTGTRVRPTPGLVVDTLTLTLHEVKYQRDPFRILEIARTDFTARLTDRAVNDYLNSQRTEDSDLREVRMTFAPGEVRAEGTLVTAGQPIAFTTAGALQPRDGTVHYVPRELSLGGVPVPEALLQQFAASLNPLINLRELRFTPLIQTITLGMDTVTLSGTANIQLLTE
jgi:hypothetical protein